MHRQKYEGSRRNDGPQQFQPNGLVNVTGHLPVRRAKSKQAVSQKQSGANEDHCDDDVEQIEEVVNPFGPWTNGLGEPSILQPDVKDRAQHDQ